MSGFYVYRHIRPDTGEVFYVGLGKKNDNWRALGAFKSEYRRAFTKDHRNIWWRRIAEISGFDVEIIMDLESEAQAVEKEVEMIAIYGRRSDGGTLVNLTIGGEGTMGVKRSAAQHALILEATSHRVVNKISGQVFPSIIEAAKASGVRRCKLRRMLHIAHPECSFRFEEEPLNVAARERRSMRRVSRRFQKKPDRPCGARWDKSRNKWSSDIRLFGKKKYLGRFDSRDDALAAYNKALSEHLAENPDMFCR